MFIGEYNHTLDDKGRIAVPAKFRAHLASGAVVTRGLDNCLVLYTKEEWQKVAEKLAQLPMSKPDARAFARLMLAGAMDVELDKQGRVVLPQYLRTFANLNSSVIIAGLFNRIEIWNEASWDNYKAETEKDSSAIAEQLGDLV
jgi:MraZ protein